MDEILSASKEFLPHITVGGVVLSAAGLVPRIGPGRAAWIALRSRFAFKPNPECDRLAEIKLLKIKIAQKNFGQSYLVVTGENGVGKSCLLNTATSKTPGVIKVRVMPGDSENLIIKNTLKQLTGLNFDFIHSAKRVIFWHRFFTLGRSPIVVLEASERNVRQEYACLTGAVRTLVDKYKLRVIVDGSPNSLDETLLRTTRQSIIEIKPMTREMIWRIEQLQDLFKYVKEAGLDDTVFAVLGGNPAGYEELWGNAEADLQDGLDAKEVIGTHLCDEIYSAIQTIRKSKTKTNDMEEIIKLFDKDMNCILCDTLTVKKLQRTTPDNVFCEVEQDGVFVLVPASNAIGIVLQHGLTEEPTLNELEELLKNKA